MSLSVMEPRFATCDRCGRQHSSEVVCFRPWNDIEFRASHPPGSIRLAFRRDEDGPRVVKILAAAARGKVHIEDTETGERLVVKTGLVISAEMSAPEPDPLSTESVMKTAPRMSGYRNTPMLGPWEPHGGEHLVLIHVWPNAVGGFDARVEDEHFLGMSGKTCGFLNWEHARDFLVDRVAMQDESRIFKFQVKLQDADPTKPNQESVMKTATPARRQTTKRKTNGRNVRVDKAHSSSAKPSADNPSVQAELSVNGITVVENDRTHFDPGKLQQLADSIKRDGIIQPLVVTPDGDGFRLIAGERRFRAAKLAKLKTVPVVVRKGDGPTGELDAKEIAILRYQENEAREDLNPIERAAAIAGLVKLHGTNKAVAKLIGVNASQVSNVVRLLELPEIWQAWIAAGKLAPTSVRPLIPYATKRPQVLQWLVDKFASDIDEGRVDNFDHKLQDAIFACTRPLRLEQFNEYMSPRKTDCHFKYDKKKHADLDVEELKVGWRVEQPRAWNVDAWDKANAAPLKKRRDKYKAAAAKRNGSTGTVKNAGGKKAEAPPAFERWPLDVALTAQLKTLLAERIDEKKHAKALLSVALFLGRLDAGAQLDLTVIKVAGVKSESNRRNNHEQAKLLSAGPRFAFQCLVGMFENLEELTEVVGVATILGLDPFPSDWQPTRDVLEAFSTDWLRAFGRDQLNLPLDEQPENPTEVLEWLEVDWPAGVVPDEIRELCEPESN